MTGVHHHRINEIWRMTMKINSQKLHRSTASALFILLACGLALQASAQDNRPPRPGGSGPGREGGGGRRDMPENKIPTSPNPGQTVGLYLNTSNACPGYTLMAPKHNTVTYLLDNEGRYVHQWKSEYEPGQTAYLLPNGHLLRAGMLRVQGGTGGGEGGRIEEFDWDGNLIWGFNHATREYQLHHDIKPMPNGHVLALMVERKTREQAMAVGFNERQMRDEYLVPDAVVEIEPVYPNGGKIVWEWHVWDHLIQNSDPSKPNYGDPAAHPELVDVACNGRATPAFWNHMNSLDYNPALDQIVLSARGCNEIWMIDHSTTTKEAAGHTGGKQGKGGDLIYRWGNPAAYGRGTMSDKQLVQQHDAEWIPDGYPGAGHMTIFNNGYDRGWSSIEEIVLPVDSAGHYLLAPGKAYGPDQTGLALRSEKSHRFFLVGNFRRATPAQRQHADLRRHRGQLLRNHPDRRDGLAIRQPDGARRHSGAGRKSRQRHARPSVERRLQGPPLRARLSRPRGPRPHAKRCHRIARLDERQDRP